MKQSFAWWCFKNTCDLETLCRAAAEVGFAGIELLEPERWPTAKNGGLQIAAHRGHDSILEGLNDPRNHDRIERELTANIALAQRWGVPTLICFAGSLSPAPDDGAARVAEGLSRVVQTAEAAGVTLAIELLNSKIDHPSYQADHTVFGLEVCALLQSPQVKLLYDVYHMQVMEGNVIATVQAHHRHFSHYHTAGVPGRHELNEHQELQYRAIAQVIAETGFSGFVGHEFVPIGDPMPALRQAFELFDLST